MQQTPFTTLQHFFFFIFSFFVCLLLLSACCLDKMCNYFQTQECFKRRRQSLSVAGEGGAAFRSATAYEYVETSVSMRDAVGIHSFNSVFCFTFLL